MHTARTKGHAHLCVGFVSRMPAMKGCCTCCWCVLCESVNQYDGIFGRVVYEALGVAEALARAW